MSSRIYLRTRAGTGGATQTSQVPGISQAHSPDFDSSAGEAIHRDEGIDPRAEVTTAVRTYSDVVASRPPSPRRERHVMPLENHAEEHQVHHSAGTTHRPRNENPVPEDAEDTLCDPWGLFFIHLMYESKFSYLKGTNSGWMKLR